VVSSAQEQRSITVPDEDTTGNLVTLQAGMTVTAFERDSDENGNPDFHFQATTKRDNPPMSHHAA
jgi:hypothetical protein